VKVLPFKIPKTDESSIHLQIDDEVYFYDKLHQHPEAQLTWVIKGEGTLIHGDYLGSFREGEIFLMGSNVPHVFRCEKKYYALDNEQRVLSKSIFFRLEQLNEAAKIFPEVKSLLSILAAGDRGLKVESLHSASLIVGFNEVFEREGMSRLSSFFNLLGKLTDPNTIQYLNDIPQKSIKEVEGRRLDDIFRFTLDNFGRRITLEEVAEVANMNKASFCRYFKQHTRKSYIDFLNEYRINQATKLLLSREKPIAQICFEVGFNNLSNFNRTFKQLTGKTPREIGY
jgi:AraC-like DNA-binding protein